MPDVSPIRHAVCKNTSRKRIDKTYRVECLLVFEEGVGEGESRGARFTFMSDSLISHVNVIIFGDICQEYLNIFFLRTSASIKNRRQ